MSISTTKPIASVTYNGTEIALKSAEKEVWVLNERPDVDTVFAANISFVSGGNSFTQIRVQDSYLLYDAFIPYNTEESDGVWVDSEGNPISNSNSPYRKLIFDTPPTGDLLTWLQANGVKQTANLAVQPSKSVSITSNGTTTVTPDAPFDGVASVAVTTNVAGVQWYSPGS